MGRGSSPSCTEPDGVSIILRGGRENGNTASVSSAGAVAPESAGYDCARAHKRRWMMHSRRADTGLRRRFLGLAGRFVHRTPGLPVCDATRHSAVKQVSSAIDSQTFTVVSRQFWSVDRNAWVPAGELQIGERLLAADGSTPAVESFTPRPEPEPVYNIEVEGDHCYRVGQQGLLVHNASQGTPAAGKPNDTPCQCDLGQTPASTPNLEKLQAELAAEAARVLRLILAADGNPSTVTVGGTALNTDPMRGRKSWRGPVLTVLKDTKTGALYYGQNHDDVPSPIEATVAKLIAERITDEKAWKGNVMRWGKPGRHSEIYALNAAMLAREKAGIPVCDFSEFVVFNVYSLKYPTSEVGDPIVRCGNCRAVTGSMLDLSYGANVLAGGAQ